MNRFDMRCMLVFLISISLVSTFRTSFCRKFVSILHIKAKFKPYMDSVLIIPNKIIEFKDSKRFSYGEILEIHKQQGKSPTAIKIKVKETNEIKIIDFSQINHIWQIVPQNWEEMLKHSLKLLSNVDSCSLEKFWIELRSLSITHTVPCDLAVFLFYNSYFSTYIKEKYLLKTQSIQKISPEEFFVASNLLNFDTIHFKRGHCAIDLEKSSRSEELFLIQGQYKLIEQQYVISYETECFANYLRSLPNFITLFPNSSLNNTSQDSNFRFPESSKFEGITTRENIEIKLNQRVLWFNYNLIQSIYTKIEKFFLQINNNNNEKLPVHFTHICLSMALPPNVQSLNYIYKIAKNHLYENPVNSSISRSKEAIYRTPNIPGLMTSQKTFLSIQNFKNTCSTHFTQSEASESVLLADSILNYRTNLNLLLNRIQFDDIVDLRKFTTFSIDTKGTFFGEDAFTIIPERNIIMIHIVDTMKYLSQYPKIMRRNQQRLKSDFLIRSTDQTSFPPQHLMHPYLTKALSLSHSLPSEVITLECTLNANRDEIVLSRFYPSIIGPIHQIRANDANGMIFRDKEHSKNFELKFIHSKNQATGMIPSLLTIGYYWLTNLIKNIGFLKHLQSSIHYELLIDKKQNRPMNTFPSAQLMIDAMKTIYSHEAYQLVLYQSNSLIQEQRLPNYKSLTSRYASRPLRNWFDQLQQHQLRCALGMERRLPPLNSVEWDMCTRFYMNSLKDSATHYSNTEKIKSFQFFNAYVEDYQRRFPYAPLIFDIEQLNPLQSSCLILPFNIQGTIINSDIAFDDLLQAKLVSIDHLKKIIFLEAIKQ